MQDPGVLDLHPDWAPVIHYTHVEVELPNILDEEERSVTPSSLTSRPTSTTLWK